MMRFELISVFGLLSLFLGVLILYSIRVLTKGHVHFDRIDQQGSSPLLNKNLMEMGYWFFQPLAKLLVVCRVSANQISFASLVFGLIAGICLAFGHFGFGAFFASVSFMMDALDGIVARMTGQASLAGEVIDAAIDRYVEFFFLGGLAIYYREIPILLGVTLLALLGAFMVSYSTAKAEALDVEVPKGSMRRPERAIYLTLGAAISPITIPWLEVDRPYGIAVAHPMVICLCLVMVMANFSAIERSFAIVRAIRFRRKNNELKTDPSESSLPSEKMLSVKSNGIYPFGRF